jgi:hypothetical protein
MDHVFDGRTKDLIGQRRSIQCKLIEEINQVEEYSIRKTLAVNPLGSAEYSDEFFGIRCRKAIKDGL